MRLPATFAALGLVVAAMSAGAQADTGADLVAVHAAARPFDAHVDIPVDFDPATADRRGTGQIDLAAAASGGLRGAALAIFVPQEAETPAFLASARAVAARKLAIIRGIAADHPDRAAIALSPGQFRAITASGRFAIVEGVVNGGAFVTGPGDVDQWVRDGVRIFGFVHAGHNRLADSDRPALTRGEGPSRNGGLSPAGQAVLARLNALGVLVDVSQLSDAAFADVLRLSRAPVIATHSDLRALVDNSRNLTDAQLDALKVNGGVIAINAYSAYLRARDPATVAAFAALRHAYGLEAPGAVPAPDRAAAYAAAAKALHDAEPKATVADLVDAVDDAVKRIGIDHVALSTDFNHGGGIVGWADESEARNVTAELLRRHYRAGDIAKLWSGNVLRVWQAAQDRADPAALAGL